MLVNLLCQSILKWVVSLVGKSLEGVFVGLNIDMENATDGYINRYNLQTCQHSQQLDFPFSFLNTKGQMIYFSL